MHDLISRQAAIDAHYEYCNKHPDAGFPVWSLKILENLPSAQPEREEFPEECQKCVFSVFRIREPERKKGKWLNEHMDYGECSECGFYGMTTDFCPNCGASMSEGGEDE